MYWPPSQQHSWRPTNNLTLPLWTCQNIAYRVTHHRNLNPLLVHEKIQAIYFHVTNPGPSNDNLICINKFHRQTCQFTAFGNYFPLFKSLQNQFTSSIPGHFLCHHLIPICCPNWQLPISSASILYYALFAIQFICMLSGHRPLCHKVSQVVNFPLCSPDQYFTQRNSRPLKGQKLISHCDN